MRCGISFAVAILVAGVGSHAAAEPFVSTLRLDPFSIISFGDEEVYQLPEGSEIQFEFSASEGSKLMGFAVRPRGALFEPIPLRFADESLRFTLGRTASGVMRTASDGRMTMEVNAFVIVTLDHPENPGVRKIPMQFTTESAQAQSLLGDRTIDVTGGRVSGRGVQLVGTATNAEDDYPRPGAPVYVVLSGVFDQLPTLH